MTSRVLVFVSVHEIWEIIKSMLSVVKPSYDKKYIEATYEKLRQLSFKSWWFSAFWTNDKAGRSQVFVHSTSSRTIDSISREIQPIQIRRGTPLIFWHANIYTSTPPPPPSPITLCPSQSYCSVSRHTSSRLISDRSRCVYAPPLPLPLPYTPHPG